MSEMTARPSEGALAQKVRLFIETEAFQRFIIGVIVINAILLGVETSKSAMQAWGGVLTFLDSVALAIFVAEIAAKLYVYRLGFFRNAWNIFDFLIVGVSLVPAGEGLSVLRSLRVLRALRLVSMVPSMRLVVQALLGSIPAMASVMALTALIFYVTAVMATKLFGEHFDEFFGTLGASLYSLFQIMTLESWSAGIVRPVMKVYPWAWAFFVPFILIATFAVLNLFIAVVVNSMTEASKVVEAEAEKIADAERLAAAVTEAGQPQPSPAEREADIVAEVRALRSEMAALRAELISSRAAPDAAGAHREETRTSA